MYGRIPSFLATWDKPTLKEQDTLTQEEEEALRDLTILLYYQETNNKRENNLQDRKRIIRERAHNELIAYHDSMYYYKDALVSGGQPNFVGRNNVPTYHNILQALPDSHEILSNHLKTQESLTKHLREEGIIPSAECFKKLLDSIDNSILQLPDFARYVTAKNPIDLYRALKEKFLIATNTDIKRSNDTKH
jgi:hypothetical protein